MAFFADLSPYMYFPNEPPGTVNVGWLEASEPIATGETCEEFRDGLGQLCKQCVRQTRGVHVCSFCHRMMGSAEIRVAGMKATYAAPELIHHYVVAHGYKPPEEFIDAVMVYVNHAARLARFRADMARMAGEKQGKALPMQRPFA